MPLAEEMAERGHEVVVVMPHPTKKPNPKLKEIIIDGKELLDMLERVSGDKLSEGANPYPPVFELADAAILVSILVIVKHS